MTPERVDARLAAWMAGILIVTVGLLGWATHLSFDKASTATEEAAKANRRLDTALDLLRDADTDNDELLEGQRTLAEQLTAAGVVPVIEVPPRRPRRSRVSPAPVTTTTAPSQQQTTTTTGPERPTTTSTTAPGTTPTTGSTTTTTRCLVLGLGCGLPGGPGG